MFQLFGNMWKHCCKKKAQCDFFKCCSSQESENPKCYVCCAIQYGKTKINSNWRNKQKSLKKERNYFLDKEMFFRNMFYFLSDVLVTKSVGEITKNIYKMAWVAETYICKCFYLQKKGEKVKLHGRPVQK